LSSISETVRTHARQAATRYLTDFELRRQDLVVEIGSNDAYLLKNFQASGVPSLGIEPAANIAKISRDQGIETLIAFFSAKVARELAQAGRKADLLLGNNVLAHSPKINDFVEGLSILLKPGGRIVLEFPYACDLINRVEFDTIYHEHVFYFTLTALAPLFDRQGLSIIDVERLPIHGGSLRIFAGHRGAHQRKTSVNALLRAEAAQGVISERYYQNFETRVRQLGQALVRKLRELRKAGNSLAAYGASAKGSTLLNFCGIGCDLLDFVADLSRTKVGRFTPGMHVPIVAPEELLLRQPDYTLLLTWNLADEILAQQAEYCRRGGRFIIPIPKLVVV